MEGSMGRFDGKVRWEGSMGRFDGRVRWEGSMGKFDGKVRWAGSMGRFDGMFDRKVRLKGSMECAIGRFDGMFDGISHGHRRLPQRGYILNNFFEACRRRTAEG